MYKTILIYCWNSICEPMTIRAMEEAGYRVVPFRKELKDYHADAAFAKELIELLHAEKIDAVFSYDYFPLLSMICQMNGLPYASWIYDCPQYTLLSKTLRNENNYIFCFDKAYAMRLQELGAEKVYHFPLAIDEKMYECAVKEAGKAYACDISFVGSLYNDKKNRIAHTDLSDYAGGYVEGIIQSQLKVYGYNLIKDALEEAVADEIVEKCNLGLSEIYMNDKRQIAADAIGMEVTSRERQKVLELLSSHFHVSLFTTSVVPASLSEKEKLLCKGAVDYAEQMPQVFYRSKINLNITSRTIETGIPQRVLDILACGGFCMTNYQQEIADVFEDGVELVMYTDMEELLLKTEYYLQHEEERIQIAQAGYEKVCAYFSINTRIRELLECLEE